MFGWTFIVKDLDDLKSRGLSASYSIATKNGINPYTGISVDEYRAEGYAILTEEEFEKIIREHDDAMCGDWKEETAEQYEYALNVLPPMRWTDGGFFVSEAETDNIHAFHQRMNGKYYTSLQRTSTPRRDILESLKTYINNR